jgi:hypothetical protein
VGERRTSPSGGTLEEVQAAAVVGRLTEDEMEAIVTEVLTVDAGRRLVSEVPTDQGHLRRV